MAKPKKIEPKIIIERKYIVPLRKGWLKVPKYKIGNKAMKTLKENIARHMKVYDRDLRKIKIDEILNNEIIYRGMYKHPAKIKVKAMKYDNGIVRVELVDIPKHVKFARLREEKKKGELEKKSKAKKDLEEAQKPAEPKPEEKEEETEKEKEKEEKQEAGKEESLKLAEKQAKEAKHTSKEKRVEIHRKALSR